MGVWVWQRKWLKGGSKDEGRWGETGRHLDGYTCLRGGSAACLRLPEVAAVNSRSMASSRWRQMVEHESIGLLARWPASLEGDMSRVGEACLDDADDGEFVVRPEV